MPNKSISCHSPLQTTILYQKYNISGGFKDSKVKKPVWKTKKPWTIIIFGPE
jgi:hypothetical protein